MMELPFADTTTLIGISLLIGILALDTTIAFQVLISHPIFSCSILGFVLGDFTQGVEIGIMMQLLWLNIVPAGAAVFPEGNTASMVTCAAVLLLSSLGYPNLVLTVAFLIGIGVSYLGAWLTVKDRKLNDRILRLTLKAAEHASFKKIILLDVGSIFLYLVLMSCLAFLGIIAAEFILHYSAGFHPLAQEKSLVFVKPTIWGIGLFLTGQLFYNALRKR